jgi:inorganic triphosphatase YgiF
MAELELKLQVPAERRTAVRAALGGAPLQRIHLQAQYHDTPDGLLASHGFSLRLRREGERWVQALKGRTGDAARREEHEVDLGEQPGEAPPWLDLARHADTRVGRALRKHLKGAGDPSLGVVYRTDIWRCSRLLDCDGSLIEAAFDEGVILAGDERRPVCELELELKSGEPAVLFATAADWCERHRLWLDIISKGQRGQLLAQGRAHAPPVKAEAPAIDRGMPGPVLARRVVAACLVQVLSNASEVAGGSTSPDHVHQLRVGIRRLRTALRELPALAPALDPAWDTPLAYTFRLLGEQRDAQVLAQALAPRLAQAGAPLSTWPGPAPSGGQPPALVRNPDFQQVLLALLAFTHVNDPAEADIAELAGVEPRRYIASRLRALHRKVVRDADGFQALPAADQHRARKRLKRLRYLAEFAAPLFGKRAVKRYLKALRPAQDALGRHNDEAVALAAFQQAAERDGRAWFAVGWLQARQRASAHDCREALREVAKADRFWRGTPG